MSDQIPMYGSGAGMSTSATGTSTLPVHLSLSFKVRSKANVLGKLVQPKFYKRIDCSVTFDPKKLNVAMSLGKNNCTYNWIQWEHSIETQKRRKGNSLCFLFELFSMFLFFLLKKKWKVEWETERQLSMCGQRSEERGFGLFLVGCPYAWVHWIVRKTGWIPLYNFEWWWWWCRRPFLLCIFLL